MQALAVVLVAVVALPSSPAPAEPSADANARERFSAYGRSARSATRGARESAGSVRQYVRGTQPLPGQVVDGEVPAVPRDMPGAMSCREPPDEMTAP